jgi:hypothetical protein
MSDWVCRECAEKDPAYQDATLFKIVGVCERCDAACPDGLLVPKPEPEAEDL